MNSFNQIEQHLLNEYQHDFPLVSRPFHAIANQLAIEEGEVIAQLKHLNAKGAISRVGPVFSPGSVGVSTLAALAVPPEKLEVTAQWISALPEVNHNYEREHEYNLWFVATAPDQDWLNHVLKTIASEIRFPMLVLPLVESFHIDLGFDLNGQRCLSRRSSEKPAKVRLDHVQTAIVAGLQSGLMLDPEPFAELGSRIGLNESSVIWQISDWQDQGVIKRFGIVVRHYELGYRENAMVVWDVPDDQVSSFGQLAAQQKGVTLCYRRPRQLPDWPFNLFCMFHGTDRKVTQNHIAALCSKTGLDAFPMKILFSRRRFKQCGARYVAN